MKTYATFDKNFILACAKQSVSIIEFSKKLGCNSRDGIRLSRLIQLEKKLGIEIISTIKANKEKKQKEIANQRLNQIYICDVCGKEYHEYEHHSTSKAGRHFCSYFCAKSFASKFGNTPEKRKAKSELLKTRAKENAVAKKCLVCGKDIPYERRHSETCSDACFQKLKSVRLSKALKGHTGGYHERSSRGKRGWYKGFYCASTYELAFVIYCLDHKISIERNTKSYDYVWENKVHKYYPDWIVNHDHYVETKNFITDKVKAKAASVTDMPIEILDRNTIKPILNYVAETYNKKISGYSNNFEELYEKRI